MQISLSLIKSFIHLDLPISQIAETLTLLGIEVDRIIHATPPFSNVIAGEVLSTAPHPHAEKLLVAQVSDGAKTFQVVCGASNCRPKMKTAFAKEGAMLPGLNIERCVIRKVESFGMLCSEEELGLARRDNGIIELPSEIEAGQDLTSLLWDPVFEISLTPNLGHCMSALGIARELSAALQKSIHRPTVFLKEEGIELESKIEVAIHDFKACPRYICRLIEGVKIAPSPFWLQQQLLLCGMKPINNAVDIANYILIKTGQPLHIFDYDKIGGQILQVAVSDVSQKFSGLDGILREIPPATLLISDAHRPIAIAGILGGANSAVDAESCNLVLEAAFFDPKLVRNTMKHLNLRTDSSQRFEKGIDPNGIKEALDEACSLILQFCGGRLAKGSLDLKKLSFHAKEIRCRVHRVNHLLGTRLSVTEIEEIFRRLGFHTKEIEKETFQVSVPQFRSDLSEEIDLIEEVARIYGYNHIEKGISRHASSSTPHDSAYLFERSVRQKLAALGLQEFLTSDLISPKLAELGQEWVHRDISLIKALHAKTEEYSILRPSLLPGLLHIAARNFDHKNLTFSAFEIGRIHFLQQNQLIEQPMAALLLTGKTAPEHWSNKSTDIDFFDLKGFLENLLKALHIPSILFQPAKHPSFHPGRQSNMHCNGLLLGSLGEVHPDVTAKLNIKQRLLYAEINLHHLMDLQKKQVRMHPISKFPSSERDWTIPLAESISVQTVFEAIQSARSPLLEKVELIDVYVPEASTQKNVSFRFTYRDPIKTISFEEVETNHQKLVSEISKLLAK